MTDICEDIDLLYNVVMGSVTDEQRERLEWIVRTRKDVKKAIDDMDGQSLAWYAAKGWLKVGDVA